MDYDSLSFDESTSEFIIGAVLVTPKSQGDGPFNWTIDRLDSRLGPVKAVNPDGRDAKGRPYWRFDVREGGIEMPRSSAEYNREYVKRTRPGQFNVSAPRTVKLWIVDDQEGSASSGNPDAARHQLLTVEGTVYCAGQLKGARQAPQGERPPRRRWLLNCAAADNATVSAPHCCRLSGCERHRP